MQYIGSLITGVSLLAILPIVRYLSNIVIEDALDEIYYFKKITKKNLKKYTKLNIIGKKILYSIYILIAIILSGLILIYNIKSLNTSFLGGTSIVLLALISGILISEIIDKSFKANITKDGIEYIHKK